MLHPNLLLSIQITPLRPLNIAVVNLCLPCRHTRQEHLLDVFERLACSLGEHEERVDCHGRAEDAENDIDAPLDVDEGRWDEVGECEVEDPNGNVRICVTYGSGME